MKLQELKNPLYTKEPFLLYHNQRLHEEGELIRVDENIMVITLSPAR
jgi:hypothetical protein